MSIGEEEFPIGPFMAGVHLKAPLCCQTGLIDSVAFELWKDLKPAELFGLWGTERFFLDRQFDVELYGIETLLEGFSLLLDSSESPGFKMHLEISCNCESLLDMFL